MKLKRYLLLVVVCCFTFGGYAQNSTIENMPNSHVPNQVNWEEFLSRHDLLWDQLPSSYFDCPFVGNGLLGAMLYQPTENLLRLDIGSSAVVERRHTEARSIVDNGRLPVGYFELASNHIIRNGKGRLDLYNAETQFSMQTDRGYSMDMNLKVLRHKDVIILDYTPSDKLECYWVFRSLPSVVPRSRVCLGDVFLNPPSTEQKIEDVHVVIQRRPNAGC